jgi:hypothetical protein
MVMHISMPVDAGKEWWCVSVIRLTCENADYRREIGVDLENADRGSLSTAQQAEEIDVSDSEMSVRYRKQSRAPRLIAEWE